MGKEGKEQINIKFFLSHNNICTDSFQSFEHRKKWNRFFLGKHVTKIMFQKAEIVKQKNLYINNFRRDFKDSQTSTTKKFSGTELFINFQGTQ